MEKAPAELMKEYVNSQKFTSTTEIMEAMKAMFGDVLQLDHTQKRGQKIKEKRRPNWEASHYYENEGGESYKSRGYT